MYVPTAALILFAAASVGARPLAQQSADAGDMRAYDQPIPGAELTFRMTPIPGGRFTMGSPPAEPGRKNEEIQHEVEVDAFWMGTCEVTWNEFHEFMMRHDLARQARAEGEGTDSSPADAVSRPTPPYVPMDFGMGTDGYPAISMTQFAAKQYTKWLSLKTGRFHRLPSEAEWEYACRAGTTTAYSFGDDPQDLGDHAWFYANSNESYHLVATKKPNPWGLFDMHGNVAEWVLDRHDRDFYEEGSSISPIAWPKSLYPRVVRGGSWDDEADRLRSAARRGSSKNWKMQDPQLPKSIWYLTDASFVGFRVIRPLTEPPEDERARYWEADLESIRRVEKRQREGGR